MATDEGIARIIDKVAPNSSFSRTAVARDVKVLPQLIDEHGETVRKLEKALAVYLKDPNHLPAKRPVCLPSKKDPSFSTYPKGQKVDAIEYLTQRIKSLEIEIKEIRQKVDKRNTMGYGFASYADISEAHSIAYTCRNKTVHGATVTLAPRPNDIIWDNMPLTSATRRTRRLWNNLWITVLTFLWIVPNAMIAIFLVNLANLGHVWPAFQRSLSSDYTFWSIVQGIASPAVTSLIYLLLPILFRRMAIKAGDQTKTGRERHVVAKLYAFFVFNNLFVFSIFSAIWSFVAGVVQRTTEGTDAWQAILGANFGLTLFLALCSVSPFWVAWLLQRQLGAAIDLAQLWPLIYGFFMRKFSSPTPRQLIELTAPPPFDYASYYNYFLFYSTVTLCYAPIQPLVLPAAAL
jgi:calcium permeable stress-gated cation channel